MTADLGRDELRILLTEASAGLNEREREVLKLLALGHTASQAADKLSLSPKTVETYRTRIMQKLQVEDVAALMKMVFEQKLN